MQKILLFIVLPVVIILVALGVWFVQRDKNRDIQQQSQQSSAGTQATKQSTTEEKPVLKNLGGITLAPYNSATGKAGDITFNKNNINDASGKNAKVFIFGQKLPKNQANEPQRINPNFEFDGIAQPIDLISAIDGVVAFIKEQPDSTDAEVFLSTKENGNWVIGYDHVTSLAVKKGDKVTVGQKLGVAAKNNDAYRYELQINSNEGDFMACPTELLDPSVKASYSAQLDQIIKDWEAWYGKDVYPEQTGGCVKPTITAAESQGQ